MVDARGGAESRVEPDLAARQAAIAAVAWLVIAVLVHVAAHARLLFPEALDGVALLSYGRLRPIADNAFLFGWLATAAICAMFAIVPRAVGAQLHNEVLGATAVIWWHLVMFAGVATLLLGMNQGRPLAELPLGVDIGLLLLSLLVFYNVAMTAVRRNEHRLYVSVWYLLAAALMLPVLIATGSVILSGVRDALVGAFYLGGLEFLFLIPVSLGIAYYVVPASTGNAVPSRTLASIGFWTLIFVGGFTGVRYLVSGPIPLYLQAIAVAMTVVALVPVLTAAANVVGAARGRWDLVGRPSAVRYAVTSVVALVVWTALSAVTAVPSVSRLVGLTSWTAGLRTIVLAVVSSFAAFALLVYVYPLLVGRTWASERASSFHFWGSLAGALTVAGSQMAAGLVQGSLALAASRSGESAAGQAVAGELGFVMRGFHWVQLAGWLLFGAAQFALAWNAARTARAGEPVQLYAMAAPTVGSRA